MSYSSNLTNDNESAQHFIVLRPRRRYTSWTLHSGSVYRTPVPQFVYSVKITGTALTEGTSTSLSAGEWYYDFDAQYLYIRMSDSGAPDSNDWIVATLELYLSTFETIWYRIPTDSTSRAVKFNGIVRKTPEVRQSATGAVFGFFPVESTGFDCVNDHEVFQELIYDASFNEAETIVYHLIGSLSTSNIQKILTGVGGNISIDSDRVRFVILDKMYSLIKRWNNGTLYNYYDLDNNGSIDPAYDKKPIRTYYGKVVGCKPVNCDFNPLAPTTSNNRIWAVVSGQSDVGSASSLVTAAIDATHFEVDPADAALFSSYDLLWVDRGGTDRYAGVVDPNYTTGEMATIQFGGAMNVGERIRKSFVYSVYIVQNGIAARLFFGRDYDEVNISGTDARGFQLTSTAEANAGCSTFDPTTDSIYCTVVGTRLLPTMNGSPFGSKKLGQPTFFNGVVVLYDILKNRVGLAESEIDLDAFTTLEAEIDDEVSFAVPERAEDDFPTFKEVIDKLLTTLLLKAYFDKDGKFTIERIGPNSTAEISVGESDILDGSYRYNMNYDELSSIDCYFGFSEGNFRSTDGDGVIINDALPALFFRPEGEFYMYRLFDQRSNAYRYLHNGSKSNSFYSYHFYPPFADSFDQLNNWALRLKQIFGERQGRLTIGVKRQPMNMNLNGVVEVAKQKLPGFSYVEGTERTRNFNIVEIEKGKDSVSLVLDDQKGIEDNSGDF